MYDKTNKKTRTNDASFDIFSWYFLKVKNTSPRLYVQRDVC